jgi:pre-mRNA-splicing factor CWC22
MPISKVSKFQTSLFHREDILNVFKFDPDYVENEAKYEEVKKELLGEDSDGESDSGTSF